MPRDDALPDYCRKPTLIVGCGNVLMGDDGFGCEVAEHIQQREHLPESVCALDAGTGVRSLLFTICLSAVRPQRVLVIDAVDAGREPGDLFELDPADIPPVKLDDFSMHQLPTSNLLRELQALCGVDVRVLACQPGLIPELVQPGLSSAVAAAVPRAARWIVDTYLDSVLA